MRSLPLDISRAQMFSGAAGYIGTISLFLTSSADQDIETTASLSWGARLDDFAANRVVARSAGVVPAKSSSWVTFDFDIRVDPEYPHFITIPPTPGLSWGFSAKDLPGTQRAEWVDAFDLLERMHGTHSFRIAPMACPYEPENVVNGVSRAEKGANLWMSDPAQSFPQWIQLDFGREEEFDSVLLTFDTNLDKLAVKGPSPECVRDYLLQYRQGSAWVEVLNIKGNYQRRRIHRFPSIRARRLRLAVEATNRVPEARVYEIRVYNENG